MSLRRLTLNTAAMSTVTVLRMLVQILVVPVLARILSPSDYGVVAMAMPFILFAMMFADAGIGISLVRAPAEDHVTWSTSFWISVLAGLALTLIIVIVGYGAAIFFAEPRLGPVVAALSVVIFLQALATIPGAKLQQQHKFRSIAGIEICAMLVSTLAALITALQGLGVWALVVQQLAHYAVKLLLTLWYSAFRPQRIFKLQHIKEHLVFGRDFLGANFIGFLTQSADNFAIGKVLGAAPVGIYSMAFLFARLPSRIVSGPLQLVIYPHFAQMHTDHAMIRRMFLFMTRIISILVFPAMGMIAAAYLPIFTIVLSQKWAASGHIFQLVAPAVAIQTVTALRGTVVMAVGRSDIILRQSLENGVLWIAALLLSVFFGLEQVAIAFDIVTLLYLPRSLMLSLPLIEMPSATYLRSMLAPIIATALAIAAYEGISNNTPGDVGLLGVAIGLTLAAIALSTAVQLRRLLTEFHSIRTGNTIQTPAT